MPLRRWTIDVAGVVVRVEAADDRYADSATARLGAVEADGEADVEVTLGPTAPARPVDAPVQELEDWLAHEADDAIWIGVDETWARIDGAVVELGGPLDTVPQEDLLDDLLQFAVAVAVARADRLMVHGAVVGRGDDALLLVGPSGQGKSTLAAAALLGGWDLLGDDLAVIDTATFTVRAVRRSPMIPAEIAERHGVVGEATTGAGDRRRVRLGVDRLAVGERRLAGLVAVEHGSDGHVEALGTGDLEVLDDALAVPPFRGVIRRQLAPGAALVTRPAVLLAHAADVDIRIERAQTLLEEAWAIVRAAQ